MAARIDANINKETIGFICAQIGVTTAFLARKQGLLRIKWASWLNASNDAYPT